MKQPRLNQIHLTEPRVPSGYATLETAEWGNHLDYGFYYLHPFPRPRSISLGARGTVSLFQIPESITEVTVPDELNVDDIEGLNYNKQLVTRTGVTIQKSRSELGYRKYSYGATYPLTVLREALDMPDADAVDLLMAYRHDGAQAIAKMAVSEAITEYAEKSFSLHEVGKDIAHALFSD